MNRDSTKVIRAAVGLAVLVVLFFMVLGWWRDFRQANPVVPDKKTSVVATSTPSPKPSAGEEATEKPAEASPADKATSEPEYVIVLIEGLNFRPEPSADSKPIRGLSEGEKLVLIETKGGWYQVRADDGTEGWVSADPQYSEISK